MEADFYADLGVSRSADESELKRAFRKKAKTCHPDVNDTEEGKVEWAKISRAYEVLSDPQQKQRYDTFGEAGVSRRQGRRRRAGRGGPLGHFRLVFRRGRRLRRAGRGGRGGAAGQGRRPAL